MPALPPVPNTLKCVTTWTVGSDLTAECVNYFKYTGGPPVAADCTTLAGDILAAWDTALKAQLPNVNSATQVTLTDLNSSTGAQGTHIGSHPGTLSSAQGPGGLAAVMNHQIGRRYRGGKPKNFLPYLGPVSLATAQTWTSGAVTAMNSGYATWLTSVIGLTSGSTVIASLVNVSYYSGFTVVTSPTTGRSRNVPKLRAGGPVIDVIVASALSLRPGSQRRRN